MTNLGDNSKSNKEQTQMSRPDHAHESACTQCAPAMLCMPCREWWNEDQSCRSIIARTIIRKVYKYVHTYLCVQVSVGMQMPMKCDSVS